MQIPIDPMEVIGPPRETPLEDLGLTLQQQVAATIAPNLQRYLTGDLPYPS